MGHIKLTNNSGQTIRVVTYSIPSDDGNTTKDTNHGYIKHGETKDINIATLAARNTITCYMNKSEYFNKPSEDEE